VLDLGRSATRAREGQRVGPGAAGRMWWEEATDDDMVTGGVLAEDETVAAAAGHSREEGRKSAATVGHSRERERESTGENENWGVTARTRTPLILDGSRGFKR
jgi:hypothetical protein